MIKGSRIPLARPPRPKHPLPEPPMLAKNGPDSRLCWARGQSPTPENPHVSSGDQTTSSEAENASKKMMLVIAAV